MHAVHCPQMDALKGLGPHQEGVGYDTGCHMEIWVVHRARNAVPLHGWKGWVVPSAAWEQPVGVQSWEWVVWSGALQVTARTLQEARSNAMSALTGLILPAEGAMSALTWLTWIGWYCRKLAKSSPYSATSNAFIG